MQAEIGQELSSTVMAAQAAAPVSEITAHGFLCLDRVPLDFVNTNPSAFTNAYFDFQGLKLYA